GFPSRRKASSQSQSTPCLGLRLRSVISMRLYPALAILEQARSFYRPEAVERVLRLQNEGWSVSPNFHFGFMASGYCLKTLADAAQGLADESAPDRARRCGQAQ